MEYLSQTFRDLNYYFFSNPYVLSNLEKLKILVTRSIRLDARYILELAIIGASHFWLLKDNQGRILAAEVMACVEGFDFGKDPLFNFSGRLLRIGTKVEQRFINSVRYELEVFLSLKDLSLFIDPTKEELVNFDFTFPGNTKTQVIVFKDELSHSLLDSRPRFIILTMHDYPENGEKFKVFSQGRLFLL